MSNDAGPSELPPPPECMTTDDPSAVTEARLRLVQKQSFFSFAHLRKRRRDKTLKTTSSASASTTSFPACTSIDENQEGPHLLEIDDHSLDPPVLEEDYDQDVYRWALMYENQRGITVFSTPYYSDQSLLPMDPPAFTIPTASKSPRRGQPTVSLTDYPLPDGTWHWVSRSWMVDMRGDGQTQYDGFEYNWFFRGKKWRAEVGVLNSGGWVRRRRWVRLMMRPARTKVEKETEESRIPSILPDAGHTETGATRPPSVVDIPLKDDDTINYDDVWRGDDDDWTRCSSVMRCLGRDTRKLELWSQWLGVQDPSIDGVELSRPQKQWSQDSGPLPSHVIAYQANPQSAEAVDPSHVVHVLTKGNHISELIATFVFPESRIRFLTMLKRTGILSKLDEDIIRDNLEFWSYSDSIPDLLT